ncbi:MAG: formate dehydrogenase accessory sulfurtransferase FdhD [Crenarchaeota archaeon]|nr:formate dehydrogenase accessory sulfurtransferase FdhD [Thermoproteota archaeon]
MVRQVDITRLDLSIGSLKKITDYVAEESFFSIYITKKPFTTITCSPSNLKELSIGHLFSEGLINSINEIEQITLNTFDNSCNVELKREIALKDRISNNQQYFIEPKSFSDSYEKIPYCTVSSLKVKAQVILESVMQLNSKAEDYLKTGSTHVAAICKTDGSIVAFAEDIRRHNALDKAVGIAALACVDFSECFLSFSGRIAADIVTKVAQVGIPIVASLGAALEPGISLAKEKNLTLIGFIRNNRMNIYSVPERIIV